MAFAYPFNLRQIGNSVSIWLGITPYELFFYIFLPPLLLDAALKIDWYMFKKVRACCHRAIPLHQLNLFHAYGRIRARSCMYL